MAWRQEVVECARDTTRADTRVTAIGVFIKVEKSIVNVPDIKVRSVGRVRHALIYVEWVERY